MNEILTFIWNMRGFGQEGRRRQLINYLRDKDVDIVGLQETIRQDLSIAELESLSRHKFSWHWLPAMGHSGGLGDLSSIIRKPTGGKHFGWLK